MILIFFCYILSLFIHEYAHEYYLYKFNLLNNKKADITYIDNKNIHKYIHPLKKISLSSLLFLFVFKSISWTQTLKINCKFIKYFKKKIIFIHLIGPISNIIISIISLLIFKIFNFFQINNFLNEIFLMFSIINFYIAFINLLPFPGLDGWNLIKYSFFTKINIDNDEKYIFFTYLILFLGIFNIFFFTIFNFIYEILFNFIKIRCLYV